ncbi:MAG: GNAT family N-acetyltransferase [Bacteroidota bacterium]
MERSLPHSTRLYLRELSLSDLEVAYEMDADPEVMQYIRPPAKNIEETREKMKKIIAYYRKYEGYGVWAGIEKETDTMVGWWILKSLPKSPFIEVGYRLRKQYWGNGYATEMTKALLEYGFLQLNLPEIVAVTDLENHASMRVLEKAGLVYLRNAFYYESTVTFYRIEREAWLAGNH